MQIPSSSSATFRARAVELPGAKSMNAILNGDGRGTRFKRATEDEIADRKVRDLCYRCEEDGEVDQERLDALLADLRQKGGVLKMGILGFISMLLVLWSPVVVPSLPTLVQSWTTNNSSGDALSLFAGMDYSSRSALVDYRMKQLAYACIQAVHQNRNQFRGQLLMTSDESNLPTIPSQILTIPFLWALFPYLKEVFARRGVSQHYIHQMALCVKNHTDVLPDDISAAFPGYACLLGNLLETASVFFSQPDFSLDMAIDVAAVMTFLLQALPSMKSSLAEKLAYLSADMPGWQLPLAVFCPVYKHMLMIVDNEEFYEKGKPLSLLEIRCSIVILRQALWQLLWVNPAIPPTKPVSEVTSHRGQPIELAQQRVSVLIAELLSQLQDWNNRRQFAPPSYFHADAVNEYFISQAVIENTRAYAILKQAPFLVPFTSRVKIFTSQLAAARQRDGSHSVFTRNWFRILRDHILEDAFNQLSALSEDDLRGLIRISFVNEFGVEEAGIDGGGIFKDFMENITRAASDVQYGLFKETADHLLYSNPGSGMIHEQHLQTQMGLSTL